MDGESMVAMPYTPGKIHMTWLEPEKSHKITQIEKEHHLNLNLRFFGVPNVNFPDFQPQVLLRTSPSTLFRSPRVDHHEAT